MPIYEYQCKKCDTFEVSQRMTEKALQRCPKCRSKVSRLLSAPAVHFKGTGWYVTDYAGKGKGDPSEGSEKSSSGPESGSSSSETGAKDASAKDSKPSKEPSKESKPASSGKDTQASAA